MPRRRTNAAAGFVAGSLIYYLFLAGAAAVHQSRLFRVLDARTPFQTPLCTRGSFFGYRVVTEAGLSHRLQPHALYLFALTGAWIFCRLNRPFREDLPLYRHRIAGLAWTFFAAIVLNLWFSVSNLYPGRFGL
jgi:hypothetical protein